MHTVLIVEDDPELRKLYTFVLENAGYIVYQATNGAEAIQFLMSQTPDVVISDMLMPMLGGEALLHRIRQLPSLRNTHLIVITAYPRFEAITETLDVDRFLVKPIKSETLLATLAEVLGSQDDPETQP